MALAFDILGAHAKEEHVAVADFLVDLDVGAVVGAERERAVHHELHVARAGSLHARERNLFRDVRGGDDLLGERNAVVRQERDGELFAGAGVGVDDARDAVDEADDELRHVIPGRRLGREYERARHGVELRVAHEAVVEDDDVEREKELALVLVQTLDLDVENRRRVELHAEVAHHPVREHPLVRILDLGERREEGLVGRELFELLEFVELDDPLVADGFGDELREGGVRLEQPAARRDAVRDVHELLRPELVEILEERFLENLRVELGDAVDGGAGHKAHVGHADVALAVLVDERHSLQALDVAGIHRGNLLEETPVDFVDDLQVAREDALHHRDGPLFERLGEDGVVGVADGARREIPRLVPLHALLIDEDAHELGDDERGVGFVEMDEHLVRERLPAGVRLLVAAEDVLERTGDEEILLAEAEFLAGRRVVVGVEDLGEVLGEHLRLDGLDVRALVEVGEVELVYGLRAPEAEGVHGVAVADDRQIVRNALDLLRRLPAPLLAALGIGIDDASAEMHDLRMLGALHLPGIAVLEPGIGLFDLVAVDDLLAEDAVVVSKAVAGAGDVEGGHGIEVARGEAPEAAIAEAGVGLVVAKIVPVDAVVLEGFAAELVGLEVDDVVPEKPPHEELEAQVVDALDVLVAVERLGRYPALDDAVADGIGECRILVARGHARFFLADGVAKMPGEVLFQSFDGHLYAAVFLHCFHKLPTKVEKLKS